MNNSQNTVRFKISDQEILDTPTRADDLSTHRNREFVLSQASRLEDPSVLEEEKERVQVAVQHVMELLERRMRGA